MSDSRGRFAISKVAVPVALMAFALNACTSTPETTDSSSLPVEVAVTQKPMGSFTGGPETPKNEMPTWRAPFKGFLQISDPSSARCLLVVDSTANGNTLMGQRNDSSPHGIFDGLKLSEQRRLGVKGWTVIPIENSLYGVRPVQAWAATQNYPTTPYEYDDLRPEDQVRYLKDVVDSNYRQLYRVQVIRLLSRPSELHKSFFSPKHKWETNNLGLFVMQNTGSNSIYRVGLVDFKDDPRWAWPRAESFSDSIKYEKTSQLQSPDWERVAQLGSAVREPSAEAGLSAKELERDRAEIAIHLSQVENFIYFLPQCAKAD